MVTGNTVPGMPGVTGREAAQALDRPVPRLAVVTEDFEPPLESPSEAPADSKVTRLIPEVEAADDVRRGPALRRSRAVRDLRTQLLSTTGGRIGVAIAALVILLAVVTAVVYARNLGTSSGPALAPTAVATQPLPTPTGFGDATATPATTPVPAGPPPGQLGINGWAQVAAGGSLVVRQAPGKAGKRITSLRDGVKVQIVDGPQQADDLTWWKIQGWDARNPQNAGWSAGKYLQPIPAPAP